MTPPPYSVALIGLGRIGFSFGLDQRRTQPASHLVAIKQLEKEGLLKLVGLCDTSDTQIEMALKYYYGNDTQKIPSNVIIANGTGFMLEHTRPDIVVISTPPQNHLDIIEYALGVNNAEKPPKLIFCEKPLSDNSSLAIRAYWDCKGEEVLLAVNHSRRFDPAWQQIQKMITDKKEMGELLFIHGLYSGETMNVGVHLADIVNWFGAPKHSVSRIDAPYLVFELTVYGEKKVVRLACNGREIALYNIQESPYYQDIWEPVKSAGGGEDMLNVNLLERSTIPDTPTPMENAYRNIIAHLRHGEPLACDGKAGLEAVRLASQWEMQEI